MCVYITFMNLWTELQEKLRVRFPRKQNKKRHRRRKHKPPALPRNCLPTHSWHEKYSTFDKWGGLTVPIRSKKGHIPYLRKAITEQGAMVVDTSFTVNLEVTVTKEIYERLSKSLGGIEYALYTSERRVWLGELQSVGPVVAFWLSESSLILNVHLQQFFSLPSWLVQAANARNWGSIDLVGPKCLEKIGPFIEPGDLSSWNTFSHLALCQVPAYAIAQLPSTRAGTYKKQASKGNSSFKGAAHFLRAARPSPGEFVRIIFMGPEHIRIIMPYSEILPVWTSLTASNSVLVGCLHDWMRLHLEYGKAFFPVDYPETEAGANLWRDIVEKNREMTDPREFLPVRRVALCTDRILYTGCQLVDADSNRCVGVVTSGRFANTANLHRGIAVIEKGFSGKYTLQLGNCSKMD